MQGPKYTRLIESIDQKYYADSYFLGCFKDRIDMCSKNHLKGIEIPLSGSFLDNINTLKQHAGSENFDNCVADGLAACYDLSIKNTMTKTPDAGICGSYEDGALRQNCFNESYPKMAISQDDIGVCNNNKEPYWLKYCQDAFNQDKAIKNKEITYCDKMSDESTGKICRDNYYFSVALATKDITFCKTAGSTISISNCASNFVNQSIFNSETRDCEVLKTYSEYLGKKETSNMYNRCITEDINRQLSKLDPQKDGAAYRALCAKLSDDIVKKDCVKRTEVIDKTTPVPVPPVSSDIKALELPRVLSGSELSGSGELSPEEILKNLQEKK